jgi:hypothetical protein
VHEVREGRGERVVHVLEAYLEDRSHRHLYSRPNHSTQCEYSIGGAGVSLASLSPSEPPWPDSLQMCCNTMQHDATSRTMLHRGARY